MNDDIVTIFQNGLKKNPNTVLTDIEANLEKLQKYQDDVLKTIAEKMTALEDFIKEKVPYAENMRGRLARRDAIKSKGQVNDGLFKYGNCKCSGGASGVGGGSPTKPPAPYTVCPANPEEGTSNYFTRDICPDKKKHTCGVGSLYQWKCNLAPDTDSYWKTAPIGQAKVSPGIGGNIEDLSQSPNEFITSVNNTIDEMREGCPSFEEACPRTPSNTDNVYIRDIGSLPVEINENKSILRSDSDGNLSTTPVSRIKEIYDAIKSTQESFAHRTVRSQKRLSNCINITNTLIERIASTLLHTYAEQSEVEVVRVSTLHAGYKNWMYSNLLAGQDSNIEFDSTIC